MVDPIAATRWVHRGLFIAIAAFFLFLKLLPLSTMPTRWPGPDLLLCLALAWLVRRPDYVPALLLAAVFLLEDMLFVRPPGLWPVIVIFGTEFLRARESTTRGLPFPGEWALIAAVIFAMLVANRLVLALMVVPQPQLGLTLLQGLVTVAAYPVIVGLSQALFGLQRPAASDIEAMGRGQ